MNLRRALPLIVVAATSFGTIALAAEQPSADADASVPTPTRLIQARCGFCHDPDLTFAFSRRVLEVGGTEALDDFLATHHAPDAEAREAIVRYLSELPKLERRP